MRERPTEGPYRLLGSYRGPEGETASAAFAAATAAEAQTAVEVASAAPAAAVRGESSIPTLGAERFSRARTRVDLCPFRKSSVERR